MPKELDIDIYDYAAYIAKLCAMKNYFVNLTKLQKLMYCAYGAVLVSSDTRICKEHPKRYPHGPVFPNLYSFAKKHHFDFIDALLNRKQNVESNLTDPQIKVINAVIDFFGKYSAGELVAWSQHPNGAWYKSGSVNQISDDLIIEYFKTLVKKVSYVVKVY